MIKPFLTYEQQLEKLSNEKQLKISNPVLAKQALMEIGYFSLIGGYKTPFIDPMTRVYQDASLEDIYALFNFDQNLRELTFKYLCKVERKIRQLISYCFCEEYGEMQSFYLSSQSYNHSPKLNKDVSRLISILSFHANINTEHAYLVHQRNVYHNVPLWVVMNALTFGQASKFYTLLPSSLQSKISKSYPNVNERGLESYLKCLTLFRNVCAHNERLYCFRLRIDFPDTIIHRKLDIAKFGKQYVQGKRDYFGLVIAFRYLLSNDDFKLYKADLVRLINIYCKNSNRIKKSELLSFMGFPANWTSITRYKLQ